MKTLASFLEFARTLRLTDDGLFPIRRDLVTLGRALPKSMSGGRASSFLQSTDYKNSLCRSELLVSERSSLAMSRSQKQGCNTFSLQAPQDMLQVPFVVFLGSSPSNRSCGIISRCWLSFLIPTHFGVPFLFLLFPLSFLLSPPFVPLPFKARCNRFGIASLFWLSSIPFNFLLLPT